MLEYGEKPLTSPSSRSQPEAAPMPKLNTVKTPASVLRMRTSSTQEQLDAWDQLPAKLRNFISEYAPVDTDAVEMLERWVMWKAKGYDVDDVIAMARVNLDKWKANLALHDYGPTHPQAIAPPPTD